MAQGVPRDGSGLCFDNVGNWSEVKLAIVREYAKAYSTILSARKFHHSYVDGFAGPGLSVSRETGLLVAGSPLNALRVDPPFDEYHLIDLDGDKVESLRSLPEVSVRANVHVYHGDCNDILLRDVFPMIRYEDYRRALCVLDPYGLHLNWEVVQAAGRSRSIEIFLNFPIMDMNRNALWHHPERATDEAKARMTAFWGDDSWQRIAFDRQPTLFGESEPVKLGNPQVVEGYRRRLLDVAGFGYAPDPIPMRNSTNAVIYYLFFASHKPLPAGIVEQIFRKYGERGL